ncbi:MAG TPA: hypothetical protein ENJ00_09660, partial [Phycisphaerales bacterium]|nr:hypothetical protein [Phycisphaerales bacterium]
MFQILLGDGALDHVGDARADRCAERAQGHVRPADGCAGIASGRPGELLRSVRSDEDFDAWVIPDVRKVGLGAAIEQFEFIRLDDADARLVAGNLPGCSGDQFEQDPGRVDALDGEWGGRIGSLGDGLFTERAGGPALIAEVENPAISPADDVAVGASVGLFGLDVFLPPGEGWFEVEASPAQGFDAGSDERDSVLGRDAVIGERFDPAREFLNIGSMRSLWPLPAERVKGFARQSAQAEVGEVRGVEESELRIIRPGAQGLFGERDEGPWQVLPAEREQIAQRDSGGGLRYGHGFMIGPTAPEGPNPAAEGGLQPIHRRMNAPNTHDASRAKILSIGELLAERQRLREAGRTLVVCHGCFDIVHPGHIRHLRQAKAMGDVLLVSVTGDAQIRKGEGRPLIPEELRAENLAALDLVDYVYVDPNPTALELLGAVKPDVYIKGREYENNADPRFAAEREAVERGGGRVVFSSGEVVFSSTMLIDSLGQSMDPFHSRLTALLDRPELGAEALGEVVSGFRGKKMIVVG